MVSASANPHVDALSVLTTWLTRLTGMAAPADMLLTPHCWWEHAPDGALTALVCQVRLDHIGHQATRPHWWVLMDELVADPAAHIYGEGFQMLAQTAGTWAHPLAIGRCPDAAHYRITQQGGWHTVHNLLLFQEAGGWTLLGFARCQRWAGQFELYPDGRLRIVQDTEQLVLRPGMHWESEPLVVMHSSSRASLLARFATLIAQYHPARLPDERPQGWCSWYHYYADITAADIEENLVERNRRFPALRYVQIDDGYQAAMGDWLIPSTRFAGGLAPLIAKIHAAGAEPALWVAPFIAEPGSRLFQDHPEWFVRDPQSGCPLPAEQVTYGGWRCTPWYVLDATQEAVQDHLRQVFATLRQAYGIRYFKLDANFWGAIHGGVRQDAAATRIEAYRRGMQAILEGAGPDAFILGCNAPMWPSLGLVDGMRVADDTERHDGRFRQIAHEVLSRNWQADRLWVLDPDCLCLCDLANQHASAAGYRVHIVTQIASGGMLLLGDRLAALDETQQALIGRLQQLADARLPAAVMDDALQHGVTACTRGPWQGGDIHCYFNWQEGVLSTVWPSGSRDLLTGQAVSGEVFLASGDAIAVWVPA